MARASSLLRNEHGASVVELGLVAPIFAAMLMGMVDLSLAFSARLQLEQAAQRTIEEVMQQTGTLTDYTANLKAEGAAAAGVAESAVVPDFYLECSTDGATWTKAATFTTGCGTDPYFARYVSVEITKNYKPMFGTYIFRNASNGQVPLKGKAGVRVQ